MKLWIAHFTPIDEQESAYRSMAVYTEYRDLLEDVQLCVWSKENLKGDDQYRWICCDWRIVYIALLNVPTIKDVTKAVIQESYLYSGRPGKSPIESAFEQLNKGKEELDRIADKYKSVEFNEEDKVILRRLGVSLK
jgi:hypothetical protein